MTHQPAISVIIPIFNAAACLSRCLDSLIKQTLHNIEIICIDDGSTDNSSDILKTYAANDKRIIVINQSNAGQSAARNAGINKASGKYIGFADADDYVDPDFYEKLYQTALASNATIIQTSTRRTGIKRTKILQQPTGCIQTFAKAIKRLNHGAVWDKIFLAEMIKNNHMSFLEGTIYEDNLFAVQALWYSKRMVIINTTCYNYIFNPSSTTTSPEKEEKRRNDSLIIAGMIIDFAIKQNMTKTEIGELRCFILKTFINSKLLNEQEYFQALQKKLHDKLSVSLYKHRQNLKKTFKDFRHKIKAVFK